MKWDVTIGSGDSTKNGMPVRIPSALTLPKTSLDFFWLHEWFSESNGNSLSLRLLIAKRRRTGRKFLCR